MSNLTEEQKMNLSTYALLADNVYWDVRSGFKQEASDSPKDFTKSNWTPVPNGWTVIGKYDESGSGINQNQNPDNKGFSARVYQNTTTKEVVIAYEGTDAPDWHDWTFGNLKSTLGVSSQHLIQAAELYEKVRNDPTLAGANITFTGHSLGGGIANVMGVWFDRPAYGFDPAPFKQSAINEGSTNVPSDKITAIQNAINDIAIATSGVPVLTWATLAAAGIVDGIVAYNILADSAIKAAKDALNEKYKNGELLTLDPKFVNYHPATDLETRATTNIQNTAIKGEILEKVLWVVADSLKSNEHIVTGDSSIDSFDWSVNGVKNTMGGAVVKHSQTLLSAALRDSNFENYLTVHDGNNANIDTIKLIMSEDIYGYNTSWNKSLYQNFLAKLIRSDVGGQDFTYTSSQGVKVETSGNSLLKSFGLDLKTLADGLQGYTNQVNPNPSDAETTAEITKKNNYAKLGYDTMIVQAIESYYFQDIKTYDGTQFFQNNNNTIQYTTAMGAGLADGSKADPYAQKWVAEAYVDLGNYILEPNAYLHFDQWNVALNNASGAALDTHKTQILISMGNSDNFTGGEKDDLLLGSAGRDTLQGGLGNDLIHGGKGNDTLMDNGSGKSLSLIDFKDNDHLYGDDGDDILISTTGDDTLEGGKDFDSYRFYTSLDPVGKDTYGDNYVKDEDGKGELKMGDRVVTIGKSIAQNVYESADGNFIITLKQLPSLIDTVPATYNAIIREKGIGGSVTINNWHNGDLGLSTTDAPSNNGGYNQVDYSKPETYKNFSATTANYIFSSSIIDSDQPIRIKGGAADDFINFYNQDVATSVEASEGSDIIITGNKNDTIWVDGLPDNTWRPNAKYDTYNNPSPATEKLENALPHDKNNKIISSATNYVDSGKGDDTVYGYYGVEKIYGNAGNDRLFGAGGTDEISGGDGNDLIHGDGVVVKQFLPEYTRDSYGFNPNTDFATFQQTHKNLDIELIKNSTYSLATYSSYYPITPTEHSFKNLDTIATNLAYHSEDTLSGGKGSDIIIGEGNNDIIDGGDDDDILLGDNIVIVDEIPQGVDADTLQSYKSYQQSEEYINLKKQWQAQYSGADKLYGGDGNDRIFGGSKSDYIEGNQGNDIIFADSDLYTKHNEAINLTEDGKKAGLTGDTEFLYSYYQPIDNVLYANKFTIFGDDTVLGGAGNDTIYGEGGNDHIDGGDDDDILHGDADFFIHDEKTAPKHGDDTILGSAGKDIIFGGGGNDTIDGGTEDDSIQGDYTKDILSGEFHGNDTITAGSGNDSVWGQGGNDTIYGGTGDDLLVGDAIEAELEGKWHGKDTIYGEEGKDTIYGAGGNDILDGGDDDDFIRGDIPTEQLAGQWHGEDTITGGAGNDTISGDGGKDTIYGGEGDDAISGDAKDVDVLYHADDTLDGGNGNDKIWGDGGNDTITGGDGDDYLEGDNSYIDPKYHGNDTIYAGAGNDTVFGDGGDDTIYGGDGDDTIYADNATYKDRIGITSGNDIVHGGAGNDVIYGGNGDDTLYGDEGDDSLIGGKGEDYLYGGLGDDGYYFDNNTMQDGKTKHIIDFDNLGQIIVNDINLLDSNWYIIDPLDVIASKSWSDEKGNYISQTKDGYILTNDNWKSNVLIETQPFDGNPLGLNLPQYPTGKNHAPVIETRISEHIVTANMPFGIFLGSNLFSDPDGDILSYKVTLADGQPLPNTLNFDTTTNVITGTLLAHNKLAIKITAIDPLGRQASQVFNLQSNTEPTLKQPFAAQQYIQIQKGDWIKSLSNIFNDADNDNLTYQITALNGNLPAGISINNQTSELHVDSNIIPRGSYGVAITATDSHGASVTTNTQINLVDSLPNTPVNPYIIPEAIKEVPYFVNALVEREDIALKGKTTITYTFSADNTGLLKGVQAYTQEQREAVKTALAKYTDVTGIEFVESTINPDLKFFLDDLTSTEKSTYAGYASAQTGEVHINSTNYGQSANLNAGNYGFEVLLHEIGHALGLKHSFEAPVIPQSEDTQNNTVMSYTSNDNNDTELKLFDVATLQYLYGVNKAVRAGNDSYSFTNKHIWDGAGNDTFDASTETAKVTIDLHQGGWSYRGEKNISILADGQSYIGFNTHIENAKGGSGNDTLISNELNNVLEGGTGQDIYVFSKGDGIDTIIDTDNDSKVILNDINTQQLYIYQGKVHYSLLGDRLNVDIEKISNWQINGKDYTKDEFKGLLKNITDIDKLYSSNSENYENAISPNNKINIEGNERNNILIGNQQNNTINGHAGIDQMAGQDGNDYYYVDNEEDNVVELANAGIDTIESTINYTLPDNVENLNLQQVYGQTLKGIGNALDNTINGTYGNDILDGKEGADKLNGGYGNDTYYIDNERDEINGEDIDFQYKGIDTVISSLITTKLTKGLENLTLIDNALVANGNEQDNIIIGNDRDNIIIGNQGNDTLKGGQGNDIYIFGNGNGQDIIEDIDGKNVIELRDISLKTIVFTDTTLWYGTPYSEKQSGSYNSYINYDASSIKYKLNSDTVWRINGTDYDSKTLATMFGANKISQENIVLDDGQQSGILIGSNNTNITGNELDNVLKGNNANNILSGNDGNDILIGYKGADNIYGGFGSDQYIFNTGDGHDQWFETSGNDSKIIIDDKLIQSLQQTSAYSRTYSDANHPDYIFDLSYDGAFMTISNSLGDIIVLNNFSQLNNNYGLILNKYKSAEPENNFKNVSYNDVEGTYSYVTGSNGEDRIITGAKSDYVIGGNGDDYIDLGSEQDETQGGMGNDTILGGSGNDVLYGEGKNLVGSGGSNDIITGGDGIDLIDGGIGDDILIAGNSTTDQSVPYNYQTQDYNANQGEWINGGAGNDKVWGSGGRDLLTGGSGQDEIHGNQEDDVILGDANYSWNGIERSNLTLAEPNFMDGKYVSNTFPNNASLAGFYDLGYAQEYSTDGLQEIGYILGDYKPNSFIFTLNTSDADFVFTPLAFINKNMSNQFERVMAMPDNLTINNNDNLYGDEGNDWIAGQLGSDNIYGGNGNDRIYGDDINPAGNINPGNDNLFGENGDDKIFGGAGNDYLDGGSGKDELNGDEGNDVLHGGIGNDILQGGAGIDTYIIRKGDGQDKVIDNGENILDLSTISLYSLRLSDGILHYSNNENDSINFDSTIFSQVITLEGKYNSIELASLIDKPTTLISDKDTILTQDYQMVIQLVGNNNINATGNSNDNLLVGNRGDNVLNGEEGVDTLKGGLGNDTYIIDNNDMDTIIEYENEGNDTVIASLDWSLGANLENLKLVNTALFAEGNEKDNILEGNQYNNTLDGKAGSDIMKGGLGDDIYFVDNENDIVLEAIDEGNDTINSTIENYILPDNVENLNLMSNVINGKGNNLNNIITGNNLNNIINGGLGDDILQGGEGNDTYILMSGNGNDRVIDTGYDNRRYGGDKIITDASIDLDNHVGVDIVELIGNANATLHGNNNSYNKLLGNQGNNTLIGDTKVYMEYTGGETTNNFPGSENFYYYSDTLAGGLGNDTYIIRTGYDQIIESAGEGNDTVKIDTLDVVNGIYTAGTSFILDKNIENLEIVGEVNFDGYGNELNNVLIGNQGDNRLNGLAGADIMKGGLGNDVYVIDNIGDQIIEMQNEGIDRIEASITVTNLANNVENINLLGSQNINATGNELNNIIVGNAQINTLNGGAGNDKLNGGLGNDILTGGSGADSFIFNTQLTHTDYKIVNGIKQYFNVTNVDRITDLSSEDIIQLDMSIFNFTNKSGQINAKNIVIGAGAKAQDSDDYILYDTTTGSLYYDTNANATGGQILIATLDNKYTLTPNQIYII